MIITNEYGTVDYSIDFSKYKRIGLSFSGGCDSTLLFYFTLKMFSELKPDAEIIPITGITVTKGLWKRESTQLILYELYSMFPDVVPKIKERYIDYNWSQEEYSMFVKALAFNEIIDIRLFALTKNPPYDVMAKHDLLKNREILRDEDGIPFRETPQGPIYDVFRNVDKRWIAEEYRKNFLLERLFPLTISCERLRDSIVMIGNEEPCKQCWWCREKKMAFGLYDGGVE